MKKKILGLAAATMATVLLVGGTYAYLQNTTVEKTNTFIMAEGVKGEIAEPKWDGTGFDGNDYIDADGNNLANDPLFNSGKIAAQNFLPGSAIAKDPMIKNSSTSTNAYVAIKITYGKDITSYDQLSKFATINFNTTDWTFNAAKTVAYYNTQVDAGKKTRPVFTTVTINNDATDPTSPNAGDTAMKNFDITVQGFMCQTTVTGATAPKQALDIVFGSALQ